MPIIFVLLMSSVAGAIGWWVGNFSGFLPAVLISTVASVYGVYDAQSINREYFGY